MARAADTAPAVGEVTVDHAGDGSLLIRLSGGWHLDEGLPSTALVEQALSGSVTTRIGFDAAELTAWDSGILTFLVVVSKLGEERGVDVDPSGLPEGLQRLLALAQAVPEKGDARADQEDRDLIERIGEKALQHHHRFWNDVEFLGQAATALGQALRGKARFRRSDLALLIQQNGFEALPIVTLVTFLLGLILAFVGAVQLQTFGATIYVADLVGVAMVRDMGALITGIIMAGRSGAAFAAQLGSMKVTQ